MRDIQSFLCQKDRETPAAGTAVKDRTDSVKILQKLSLDMVLLDNVVYICFLAVALKLAFVRLVSLALRYLLAVIHIILL